MIASQSQSQSPSNINFNESLHIDGQKQSVGEIIAEMNKVENLHLKKLRIADCLYKSANPNLSAIANILPNLKHSLESLTICNSVINLVDAKTIADFIIGSTLKKFKLSSHGILNPTSIIMIDLIKLSSIQKLEICGFYIRKEEASFIAKMLKSVQLVELSLTKCHLDTHAFLMIIDAVKHSALKVLNLKCVKNKMNMNTFADHVANLADCITNSSLTKLSLFNTSFKPTVRSVDERPALIAAIQKSSLRSLNMLGTQIFFDIKDVIDIVARSQITKFTFDNEQFDSKAMVRFIDAVRIKDGFKNICLNKTFSDDQLLVAICNLIENSALTHLDLNCCYLSDDQWGAILASIKRSGISSFGFTGNYLNIERTHAICDLLEHHNIQKMHVYDVPDNILRAILPSVQQSSLIKFTFCKSIVRNEDVCARAYAYGHVPDGNVRNEIKDFVSRQKRISNSSRQMKSARTHAY